MTNEQLEKIEAFLQGKMQPDDQLRFEQELTADQELLAAYNTYRSVETHMFNSKNHAGEEAVKKTLTRLGAEFFPAANTNKDPSDTAAQPPVAVMATPATAPQQIPRIRKMVAWKWVAAVFMAVAATAAWYLFTGREHEKNKGVKISAASFDSAGKQPLRPDPVQHLPALPGLTGANKGKIPDSQNRRAAQTNPAREKLFAGYFKPDTVPAGREGPLRDAFDQYERKEYKNAAAAFEAAELDLSTRGEQTDGRMVKFWVAYYKALSYLATGRDAAAIQALQHVKAPDDFLQAKITWYLALAYLKTGNNQNALLLLKDLSGNEKAGEYNTAAAALIDEVKKTR